MKILKFGGTSLGSIESLKQVRDILVDNPGKKIVVCSAMSGVTNQLVAVVEQMKIKEIKRIDRYLFDLESKHLDVIHTLISDKDQKEIVKKRVSHNIKEILELTRLEYSETIRSKIITQGEALLTLILSSYLNQEGVPNTLIFAKEFMLVDSIENPNIGKVTKALHNVLENSKESEVYITQGFICKDNNGEITDLERGGSDFSATIIGAAINAETVEIWTDIDGVHNNDPRCVNETNSIPYLSYSEASKLAYFGAKVLHPKTILPLINKDIPVILKNTFKPKAKGTVISNKVDKKGMKAISAKDNITIVKIESNADLVPHDFFKKIFDIFHRFQISIDIVITSEKSMSLTIDDTVKLSEITKEIRNYAEITTESLNTIICIVGDSIASDQKTYRIFNILKLIPIKMISLGKNDNNISVLIDTSNKVRALKLLQENLFLQKEGTFA